MDHPKTLRDHNQIVQHEHYEKHDAKRVYIVNDFKITWLKIFLITTQILSNLTIIGLLLFN
jgi:hypothetical protein